MEISYPYHEYAFSICFVWSVFSQMPPSPSRPLPHVEPALSLLHAQGHRMHASEALTGPPPHTTGLGMLVIMVTF